MADDGLQPASLENLCYEPAARLQVQLGLDPSVDFYCERKQIEF